MFLSKVEDAIVQALAQQRRPNSARQLVSGMCCHYSCYLVLAYLLNDRLKRNILIGKKLGSEGIEIGKKVALETLFEALYATRCLFPGSVEQTEICTAMLAVPIDSLCLGH